MFLAPMGRFQLELMYYFTFFFTVVPSNICMFLFCRPFVVITFSTGLMGVENIVIKTKGLEYRNIHILDGTTVENKGKTIH